MFARPTLLSLGLLVTTAPLAAQLGDRDGEVQADLPADLVIPPAPALSPEQQLATFQVPPGYRVELVAAEPLVHEPVVIHFDGDGRLWVCEMRGFMPDVDGTDEDAPVGSIAVLEDTDGDGRMDKRTEFLSELVLPRAILPMRGGAMVISPPEMFFAEDTDGDGRADKRTVLMTGLGGIHSPEHAINGMMPSLDNWILFANQGLRMRFVEGEWIRRATTGGGQWGITQDDDGRVFFNTNSDGLRGDPYPSHYAVRNPHHGKAGGTNVRIAQDQTVWPSRITPGVNRGYRKATLRDDFTLARFTGACAPHIYRGAAFPEDAWGNAFVCEPCGHLLKRYILEDDERGRPKGTNAYQGREFLTSTDERFRPVELCDGPDGALYIADLYRGVLQHRIFVTSFLRKQIKQRQLENPVGLGRIWRVVHEEAPEFERARMSEASWTELAEGLAHPNGWWRDESQRAIVEEGEGDADAIAVVRGMLDSDQPLGRVHALWALEGIGGLQRKALLEALTDPDPRVQRAALRVAEVSLAGDRKGRFDGPLRELASTADLRTTRQLIHSLGEARTQAGDALLLELAHTHEGSGELRHDMLSGLGRRELAFLESYLADRTSGTHPEGRRDLLTMLAKAVARENKSQHLDRLFALASEAADSHPDEAQALLRGALAARTPGPKGEHAYLHLARKPESFATLTAIEVEGVTGSARELAASLAWPGREDIDLPVVRALTDAEQDLFDRGAVTFAQVCSTCHQTSGLGEPGKAPRLRQSPWVLGSEERLVRVIAQGLVGPLTLDGETWNMEMPALEVSDEELAAVVTYVRREWGHGADPVTPETVGRIREQSADRATPWTVKDLEGIK